MDELLYYNFLFLCIKQAKVAMIKCLKVNVDFYHFLL